jgi:hypothetical protein
MQTHNHYCLACGRAISDPSKSIGILVIETHSQRAGSAYLHGDCCDTPFHRYMQTVTWETRVTNVTGLRALYGRIAYANGARHTVPLLMT